MRTRLTAWIVMAAVGALLGGLLLGSGRLLVLALPLIVYLALTTAFATPTPQVRVTRVVEREEAFEGEEVEVTLRVENQGPSLELLEVWDRVPSELPLTRGSRHLITPLSEGEVRTTVYALDLRAKGRHELGPVVLRSRDVTNMFVHETSVDEVSTLVVSPLTEDLRRATLRTRRLRRFLGQIPSRSPGLGTDFWSIRDYAHGDEMRRINWKVSARLEGLFTNEFEGEQSGDFVLVLDARAKAAAGSAQENAVQMAIRGAASLASVLLQQKNRVGLVVLRAVLDWVYPDLGRGQYQRIVESLLRVKPGGQWTLRHLPWLLGRFFPPGCHLILLAPTVDREARQATLELRARGFDALVISPSPLDFEVRRAEPSEFVQTAYNLLRLEREAQLNLLKRFVPVVDWRPGEPLTLPLMEVERRQRVRR